MNKKQALEVVRLINKNYFEGKAEVVEQTKSILMDLPKDAEGYKIVLALNSLSIFFKVEDTVDNFGQMFKINLK